MFNVVPFLKALPHMDAAFRDELRPQVEAYAELLKDYQEENPFGVPITRLGWAGNGFVVAFAINKLLPAQGLPRHRRCRSRLPGPALHLWLPPGLQHLLRVRGRHPLKEGGLRQQSGRLHLHSGRRGSGLLILPPTSQRTRRLALPLGENEYVIGLGASYVFAVHAVDELLQSQK
jgi:hypothetical protein